jgi:hypothetical protein
MKYGNLRALLAKLEDLVDPELVRIVTAGDAIGYIPYARIRLDILNNLEGCDPIEAQLIRDAVEPSWLINSRDIRWASTHPVDT